MEQSKTVVHFLTDLPPDVWSHLVFFLPLNQLIKLNFTGSRPLWRRLRFSQVVRTIIMGKDGIRFKSWPSFLNELPSIEELIIDSPSDEWWSKVGIRLDTIPPTLRKLSLSGSASFDTTLLSSHGRQLYLDEQLPFLETLDVLFQPQETGPPKKTFGLRNLGVDVSAVDHVILPSSITELQVDAIIPGSCWSILPPTLVKLIMVSTNADCAVFPRTIVSPITEQTREVKTFPFENLPRSITFLELYLLELAFVDLPPESKLPESSIFPPEMMTLRAAGVYFTPNAVKRLPASLTHLELVNLCENICQCLPKGLTELRAENTLMSPDLIALLPHSLKRFSMYASLPNYTWYDYDTGEALKVHRHTAFSIHREYQEGRTPVPFQFFPPNITSLSTRSFLSLGRSVSAMKLSQLRSLELIHSRLTDSAVSFLSRSLTQLAVPNCSEISGKCFTSLPRGLTSLNISSCSFVFDSDIMFLPRTLISLQLGPASSLTNHCIRDFPRGLEKLVISSNSNITKAAFPFLPPPLKVFPNTFEMPLWKVVNGMMIDKK